MKRRLFTILSALSLLLFVAVVVLWVRSYWVGDAVSHTKVTTWTDWYSWSGRCAITHGRYAANVRALSRWKWTRVTPAEIDGDLAFTRQWRARVRFVFAGFEWIQVSQGEEFFRVVVPYWFPAVAALGIAYLSLTRRPFRAGLCSSCGYDLRATPDRCPECGATPAPPS